VPDILAIDNIKIRFADRQIVNGIEQVGFSDAVVPDKAIYLFRKRKISVFIIFKIKQRKFLQEHLK
jgi:hypothetical protein